MVADAKTLLDQLISALLNLHTGFLNLQDVKDSKNESPLLQRVNNLGQLVNQYKGFSAQIPVTKPAHNIVEQIVKTADVLDEHDAVDLANMLDKFLEDNVDKEAGINRQLMKIADDIDESGQHTLADKLDNILNQSKKNVKTVVDLVEIADKLDSKGLHELAASLDKVIVLIKNADSEEEIIQQPHEGSLKTRYCPDHRGVQTSRIDENVYQCSLDGKKYDYSIGYTNYKGQKVPGGSVAAQTPETTDFGGIPMRIYDHRQNVLRSVH